LSIGGGCWSGFKPSSAPALKLTLTSLISFRFAPKRLVVVRFNFLHFHAVSQDIAHEFVTSAVFNGCLLVRLSPRAVLRLLRMPLRVSTL